MPLESYGLVGNTSTAALVGRDGSIDWLCLPRFDSAACFAALVGDADNGRWQIAPVDRTATVRRSYRDRTMVLETLFELPGSAVRVIDFMPVERPQPRLVRIVEGVRGRTDMAMELVLRFDYGRTVPWVRRIGGVLVAVAGPGAVTVRSDVPLTGEDLRTVARFPVGAGQRVTFDIAWHHSTGPALPDVDPASLLEHTTSWWREWMARRTYEGEWEAEVNRSLLTLKALTFAPSGGIVAAPTTSLPEGLGGTRNWDYRYCWVRDATFTLYALMNSGYREEARRWRDWLLRAVAGHPSQLQVLYGVDGERLLPEVSLRWLAGYEMSAPVRIGNGAVEQFQLDVFGEIMDLLHAAGRVGLEPEEGTWEFQEELMDFLEGCWEGADEGIWEVRGPRRDFTHSKVMAWVAFDRAIKTAESTGVSAPLRRWRAVRARIHDEVCRQGFDEALGSFVQSYGSTRLDASALLIPLLGFLPADDRRVQGTLRAVERHLVQDGFVRRYHPDDAVDGLHEPEGAFLACSFWLVDNLVLAGRRDEARRRYTELLSLRNDVGLLAEEYDPAAGRLVGNFPQAFSHVGVVNSALNLAAERGPVHHRCGA